MGTRIRGGGTEKVYAAAETWVERALRADDSLFTSGKAIWSRPWLGELHDRFLNHPDESSDSFLDKLQQQLADSPPEVYQLMGEVLYFYFLIVATKNSANEQRVIDTVLGWSPSPVEVPQELVGGLTPGIARPGLSFRTSRPFQVGFIIEFAEWWKEQGPDERDRLLANPWEFKEFVMRLNFRSVLLQSHPARPRTQREAMLHLVFPDTFEPTVSVGHKERIARAFAQFVTGPEEDVDRKLEQIRLGLEAQYGSSNYDYLSFYRPDIRVQWDPAAAGNGNLWDEFVRLAQEYFDTGQLDSEENDYKVAIGRKVAAAREAALSSADDWADLLKSALNPNDANFISWRLISNLNQWCAGHPDEALRALQAIWAQDDSSVSERVGAFSSLLPYSEIRGTGSRVNVASGLLMGLDVHNYPPFRIRVFNRAYERTGYEQPERDADEAALYEHALGFLDRFIEEASERGLTLRHRLDAQSLVWAILQGRDQPTEPEEDTPPLSDEFSRKLEESFPSEFGGLVSGDVHGQGPPETIPELNRSWVFQANPRFFNLPGALQEISEFTWTTRQYRGDIKAGDKTYLWESGPAGGILATAVIETDPAVIPNSANSRRFEPQPDEFAGEEARVLLAIRDVLTSPISRAELLDNPILSGMQILKAPQGTNFPITEREVAELERLVGSRLADRPTIEDLARETHLPPAELGEIEALLQEKKQIIFEGPPGTGKTYVARLFAKYFTGLPLTDQRDQRVRVVQFHQSYGYEEFIQGIRPETNAGGQIEYHVRPGVFKDFCAGASRNPSRNFVLIIDEINRGNISRIFGELLYLLEYRDEKVPLANSRPDEESFSIPQNVFIIGTMNTTDRSLAQIDYALRRRFYFYRLLPASEGTAPVLESWLARQAMGEASQQRVLATFLALNTKIAAELGEHFQIGHSYFMHSDIDTDERLEQVWRHAILPLLEEYYHGRRDMREHLNGFRLSRLIARTAQTSPDSDE